MSWINFNDSKTGKPWQLNQEGLFLLVRANVRANLIRARTTIEVTEGGFLMPDTSLVVTNWNGFRSELDSQTQNFYSDSEKRLSLDGVTNMPANLAALHVEVIAKTKQVEDLQKKAQKDTFESIDSTVDGLETAKTVAEFTRDLSATVLVTGAGVMTGGGAWAVLGAGAGMKGIAKFQDTGNVGAAILEATSTIVVGALKIKAPGVSLSSNDEKTLIFVGAAMDGTFEGVKGLMDGQSASTAMKMAAVRFGGTVLLENAGLKIEKMPLFGKIMVSGGTAFALDKTVIALTPKKVLEQPANSGKIDFAAAISGSIPIASDDFVQQFVLRPQ